VQGRPPTVPLGGGFTRIPYASLQLGRELGSGAFSRVLLAKLNYADVVVKELFNPSAEVTLRHTDARCRTIQLTVIRSSAASS
jgi:hypothetical protein